MKVIVLEVKDAVFTLANCPDDLHLAFNFVREALIGQPWSLEIIEYGPQESFWYNIRNANSDLLYQIRILV